MMHITRSNGYQSDAADAAEFSPMRLAPDVGACGT